MRAPQGLKPNSVAADYGTTLRLSSGQAEVVPSLGRAAAFLWRCWCGLERRSPFEEIHFVRQHGFAVAEKRNDDAQTNGSFRRRIGNDEQREDLPGYVTVVSRKSHQIDVHR